MAVYIGHASIDENGKTQGGAAGDQTGKEVCKRTWYVKTGGWGFAAIHPDATVREKHASAIEDACANAKIGYDQNQRNTLYTQAKTANFDLSAITTACECDCSSLQNVAAIASGAVSVASYGSNGWTTSVMKAKLKAAGYIIIEDSTYLKSADYCVRGAIYVKSGSHTVCGLTNGSSYTKTLEKAGISSGSTSGSTSGTTASSSKPSYTVGKTYTTQVDKLNVRTGAGTGCSKVSYSKLTANAKANAYSSGQLKKGTKVTCKEVKTVGNDIWMKIPSGWIAAYYDGKVYVK